MKNLLLLAFIAGALFTACSKKNNGQPNQPANAVSINGRTYTTVVIGSQTWTAVNYNGAGGVDYSGANNAVNGKLYTYAESKAITLPTGWRVPTQADFNNLEIAIGEQEINGNFIGLNHEGYRLMSKTGWTTTNGTDDFGFNAKPAGLFNQVTANDQEFNSIGTTALFLSSTLYFDHGTFPFTFIVGSGNAQLSNAVVLPTDRASIRFVKDN